MGAAGRVVNDKTPLPARLARGLLSVSASVGLVLLAWWLFLKFFDVPAFLGKTPADVWKFLFSDPEAGAHRSAIWDEGLITLRDSFLGLVVGSVTAVLAAVAFNVSRPLERTLMPIAMVLRSVPLVAMTPLILLMFGRGLVTVTVIASIVTFFPTLVNVTLALRATPRDAIDLLKAYGASPLHTLLKVQLPSALPSLFASLRISAPLALVGALLSEWLATGTGLGYGILYTQGLSQYADMWSRVVVVTLMSIVLYKAIGAVERPVLARYAPKLSK